MDPDPWGRNGKTPLICAARKGHEGVVRLLLGRRGVSANGNNEIPLWCAANKGHEAEVQLLLEGEGVSMDSREKAVRLASLAGNEAVAELLKKKIQESPGNLGLQ